jgi:hypothetical protein
MERDHIPPIVSSAVTLGCVNQLITHVSNLWCKLVLVSDGGEEISPCERCGITYTTMFRRLVMRPGGSNHPTLDFDVMMMCNDVRGLGQ